MEPIRGNAVVEELREHYISVVAIEPHFPEEGRVQALQPGL